MEQVITKLNEAYQDCVKIKKEWEAKLTAVNNLSDELNIKSEKLVALEKSLTVRETAVKPIEDLVKYRQEADALIAQAKASLNETNKRIISFSEYEGMTKRELKQKEEALSRREDEFNKKEAKLEQTILENVQGILKKAKVG